MAETSREGPTLEFGPDLYYPSAVVANEVIWPLVDLKWEGDYRKDAELDDDFGFPKRGRDSGRLLRVILAADCDDFSINGEYKLVRTAHLFVEEEVTEEARPMVLAAAKGAAVEETRWFEEDEDDDEFIGMEAGEDDEGDTAMADYESPQEVDIDTYEPPMSWPGGDEEDLIISNGQEYAFEADGDLTTSLYRKIRGNYTAIRIGLPELETDTMSQNRLRLPELEVVEAACYVLGAPRFILKALQSIKNHPSERV